MKKAFISLFVLLFVIVLSGCTKKAEEKMAEKMVEKTIENQIGQKVDIDVNKDGNQFKMENKETGESVTIGTTDVPDAWPDDFPLYDAQVTASVESNQGVNLTMESDDSVEDIQQWYEDELEGSGWKQQSVMGMGVMWSATYEQESEQVSVLIAPGEDDGISNITLVYVKK